MKFLGQGFQKSEPEQDRQTDRDTLDWKYYYTANLWVLISPLLPEIISDVRPHHRRSWPPSTGAGRDGRRSRYKWHEKILTRAAATTNEPLHLTKFHYDARRASPLRRVWSVVDILRTPTSPTSC